MGLIFNLRGPAGPAGATGAAGANGTNGTNGAAGAPGTKWYDGTSLPADSVGNDGDYFMNSNTGDVSKKVNGTWA